MFRAAALSLVLALAAGPNVSWVCGVLCDQPPATTDCGHANIASVIAAADHCCEIAAPSPGRFVPRDVRLSGVPLDNDHASPAVLSPLGDSVTEYRRGTGESSRLAQGRPSSAPLRL